MALDKVVKPGLTTNVKYRLIDASSTGKAEWLKRHGSTTAYGRFVRPECEPLVESTGQVQPIGLSPKARAAVNTATEGFLNRQRERDLSPYTSGKFRMTNYSGSTVTDGTRIAPYSSSSFQAATSNMYDVGRVEGDVLNGKEGVIVIDLNTMRTVP